MVPMTWPFCNYTALKKGAWRPALVLPQGQHELHVVFGGGAKRGGGGITTWQNVCTSAFTKYTLTSNLSSTAVEKQMSWLKAMHFDHSGAGRSGGLVLIAADTQELQLDVSRYGYLGGGNPGGR